MKKLIILLFLVIAIISFLYINEVSNVKPIVDETAKTTKEVITNTADQTVQKTAELKEKIEKTPSDLNERLTEMYNNRTREAIEKESASEENKTEAIAKETKAIAFGDSLTFGEGLSNKSLVWISLIEPNVKNYAVSGATTYDVLNQIKNINDENTAYLWIGANDAAQLVSLTDFEANYISIVKTIKDKNMTLIILNIPDATKLDIADEAQKVLDNYLIENYGFKIDAKPLVRQYTSLYNNVIQNIAKEYNVKVIDMFNFMNSFSSEYITADQFHPNEAGHKLIAEEVKRQI